MGTVVKVALGVLLALVVLVVGCGAIIGIGAGLEQPGGGEDTALEAAAEGEAGATPQSGLLRKPASSLATGRRTSARSR